VGAPALTRTLARLAEGVATWAEGVWGVGEGCGSHRRAWAARAAQHWQRTCSSPPAPAACTRRGREATDGANQRSGLLLRETASHAGADDEHRTGHAQGSDRAQQRGQTHQVLMLAVHVLRHPPPHLAQLGRHAGEHPVLRVGLALRLERPLRLHHLCITVRSQHRCLEGESQEQVRACAWQLVWVTLE
jgi:hypothetical protein